MKDVEYKVLEQYCVDVNGVRRAREGYLCDTMQGLLRIKEIRTSVKKIPYVQYLCQQLMESGYGMIDMALLNKENSYACRMRDGETYILKHWFVGRECDVYREKEVIEACRTLALLHQYLDEVSKQIVMMQKDLEVDNRWDKFTRPMLTEEWKRHNRGLKKTYSYMRKRVSKGPFERLYLQEFEYIYAAAEAVTEKLQFSGYQELYEKAIKEKQLIHGDYNYHNILFVGPQVVITNFDRFRVDVAISDLYYFMRKVMEKNNWDEKLGLKMLTSYHEVRCITAEEIEYIGLRLSYPEKVWKLINQYYNSNKAMICEKNVEKLRISVEQMEIKRHFVQHILSFQL